MLTIGELASRVGVKSSTLRYYEREGLLSPDARTDAGYRLYDEDAEDRLRFIQASQRLGFTLEDIRGLVDGLSGGWTDDEVRAAAEDRLVDLERRLTELLVTRHEMERFLHELGTRLDRGESGASRSGTRYERLITHLCGHETDHEVASVTLDWLQHRTGCRLADFSAPDLSDALADTHVHLWQRDGGYHILIASHDDRVERALRELARIEAECHAHPTPTMTRTDEGWLFVAKGDDAFLFAQFFLAIDRG